MALILSYPEVRARAVNLSKHRLWVLERAGRFPRRVNVSTNRIGWIAEEIDAYLAACIAARNTDSTPVARPRSPGRPRKQAEVVAA